MRGDGDGWVQGADGARRWGRFGAAGLLLRAPDPARSSRSTIGTRPLVLLQHRAEWSHHGGTWGLPGGARDSDETPEQAALREAFEEAALDPAQVHPRAVHVERLPTDPSGWSYTTVLADTHGPLATTPNAESQELRWVPESEVPVLDLHPSLRGTWPRIAVAVLTLVVDTANVLGSVPDGWWRDRSGSTARLLGDLAAALPRTVELPTGGFGWIASAVAVVEGAARDVPDIAGIEIRRAPGSGDDTLADVVPEVGRALVVTADRGLRARLPPGVAVVGPAVVRGWLPTPDS